MDPDYDGLIRREYNADGPALDRFRADKRLLDYPTGALQPMVIDLTNAQTMKEFGLSGDMIYLDRRTTGLIKLRLDPAWPAGFALGPNDALKRIQYKQLLLEWDAQPGLVAYLWTGYGVDFALSLGAISTINSITQPITFTSAFGVSFATQTAMAANTPQNVIGAGSNINGIRVFNAGRRTYLNVASATIDSCILAKATAPATVLDGDQLTRQIHYILDSTNAISMSICKTPDYPQTISLGKRLDFISANVESAAYGSVNYTIL